MFFVLTICSYGQEQEQNKNYFPIWTFHQKNINIHGISVGLASTNAFASNIIEKNTNTNGIKLELIGWGILVPMIPYEPDKATFGNQRSERINGINLSASGTLCDCLTNGIVAGFIGQLIYQANGISFTMLVNYTHIQNGIMASSINVSHAMNGLQFGLFGNHSSEVNGLQIALIRNNSEKTNGLQIGIYNESKNLKGIQIGIWNVNQKRKLPLLNWNF